MAPLSALARFAGQRPIRSVSLRAILPNTGALHLTDAQTVLFWWTALAACRRALKPIILAPRTEYNLRVRSTHRRRNPRRLLARALGCRHAECRPAAAPCCPSLEDFQWPDLREDQNARTRPGEQNQRGRRPAPARPADHLRAGAASQIGSAPTIGARAVDLRRELPQIASFDETRDEVRQLMTAIFPAPRGAAEPQSDWPVVTRGESNTLI